MILNKNTHQKQVFRIFIQFFIGNILNLKLVKLKMESNGGGFANDALELNEDTSNSNSMKNIQNKEVNETIIETAVCNQETFYKKMMYSKPEGKSCKIYFYLKTEGILFVYVIYSFRKKYQKA